MKNKRLEAIPMGYEELVNRFDRQMKHTPGPWEVIKAHYTEDGIERHITSEKCGVLARCFNDGYISVEQCEANARLIAKAPEMLEALKDVRQVLESIMLDRPVNVVEALYNVTTLIAQIEGGDTEAFLRIQDDDLAHANEDLLREQDEEVER